MTLATHGLCQLTERTDHQARNIIEMSRITVLDLELLNTFR